MPRGGFCPTTHSPTLVVHCCAAVAGRLAEFITCREVWHDGQPPEGYSCVQIDNPKYPELLLFRAAPSLLLLNAIWAHPIASRYVHAVLPVDGFAPSLDAVWGLLQDRLVAAGPLRIYTFPAARKVEVLQRAEATAGLDLDPKAFRHLLILLKIYGRWYYGLLPRADWHHGEAAARCDSQKLRHGSNAHWKLAEVFARFRIRLPHGFHALDIGASPGGWTAVLADLTEPHVEPPPSGTEGALRHPRPRL